MSDSKQRTTRRDFIHRMSAVSLSAVSLPSIVPSSVRGSAAVAPSDRIVMGCIGVGGRGKGNMKTFMSNRDVHVVAVCDVDAKHRKEACDLVNSQYGNSDCAAYVDYRELVGREDIDVVSVATPDHWHALNSIAAAEAGKDVYCEKPLANSVAEGRAITDAVVQGGRILQTGSHERSNEKVRFACELVRNGRIGKLHTIEINLPCNQKHHQAVKDAEAVPPAPIPDGFDYDFWLGHTPEVPFSEKRCHFWWRFILSYGGGEMTDRGAHVIDLAQLGADMDHTGPVEIMGIGSDNQNGIYDSFMDYKFVNTYANGVRMIGENREPRGLKFVGTDGWVFIHIHGGKLEANPPSLLDETIGESELQLGRSPGHHRNFLDAVKSRQQPMASAEVGHRTATICHLNNIAMLTGLKLEWDPDKELITNNSLVNNLLAPAMREPWRL